jgi:D-lactate dehydrogenase (cytochrome)
MQLLVELQRIVGKDYAGATPQDLEVYSYDGSLATARPRAVVLPGNTQQVAAVVRLATQAGVPYVPRGFGTNLSGGSVTDGGLVIGLARLNRILAIRPDGRYAVVQPGVTNLELQNALAPLGFHYAPDPASQKVSTLGGNVGENAGGPHCLKYGVTTNHILGATVVLEGGEVVRIGGPSLDPPGYDLRGVLVGSEGTLGIVTELVVRILPLAESVVTLLAVYDRLADAARSVSAIIAEGIVPATLEMMDATVIQAVEDSKPCGYPRDAAAVLIVEVDGPRIGLADQAERIRSLCLKNGCREVRQAKDAAERDRLWAGRRGAFGAIARLAPSFLVADCTVPRTLLPDALARVAAIAAKHRLPHGNVFHAGDGNLHPLLLFDSRDPEQVERVHQAGREIMEACVALGGTISGEHGVGREKADAMRLVFSEDDLDFQRRLRDAMAPRGLLNPGKIFPDTKVSSPADPTARPSRPGPLAGNAPPIHDFAPADVAEACELVKTAYAAGRAVLPCGNRTQLDGGNSGGRPTLLLRSVQLASVKEYDPANQVIAVGSGMSLASLQAILAEHRQWLPLRPPLASRRSIGGIVAMNACGPERLRYGAPRDLLLGLKFISGEGRLISAGGRVVKNVAGYDVTRLMAGSAGTLGFLAELTLRVSSLPESCVAVSGSGTLSQCAAVAADLLRSKLEPCFVVAWPQDAAAADGRTDWLLWVGFEGFHTTVQYQSEAYRSMLGKAGMKEPSFRQYDPREGIFADTWDELHRSELVLRVDLPLDCTAAFLAENAALLEQMRFAADFGCGRITAATAEWTDEAWTRWKNAAWESGGTVILEKAPEPFCRKHDRFGMPRADWPLMHKIKAALDPGGIFAPGGLPGERQPDHQLDPARSTVGVKTGDGKAVV